MRTYKEFTNIIEEITGATLGFRKTFGAPIGRSTSVTGSVQGGAGPSGYQGTTYSASGSLGGGTVSGQGDRINQGIDAALKNLNTGSNANTSTSTVRSGMIGSLNANVSGGISKPQPKPTVTTPEERPQQSGQQQSSAMSSAQAQEYAQKRAAFKAGSENDEPAYAPPDVRDQLRMMRAKTPQDTRLAGIARQYGVK